MRKFIIKNFILTKKNDIRLAITNFLCLFTGLLPGMFIEWNIVTASLIILPIFSLFITFLYFRLDPVAWDELNDEQKWNVGIAVQANKTTMKLTKEQLKEWELLNERFSK